MYNLFKFVNESTNREIKMDRLEIVQRASNWYDWSRCFVPEIETIEFSEFVGQSNTFTYAINPTLNRVMIAVDHKTHTAYVDLDKQNIFLPPSFFTKEMYLERFGSDLSNDEISKIAISVINGNIIHEAQHLLLTPNTAFKAIRNSHTTKALVRKYGYKFVFTIFNIIEDIYIDSHTPSKMYNWFRAAVSTLIPVSYLDEIRDNDLNTEMAVNLAIVFKNPEARNDPIFSKLPDKALKVLERASKFIDPVQLEKRLNLVCLFIEAIEDILLEDKKDEGGEDSSTETAPSFGAATDGFSVGEGERAMEVAEEAAKELDDKSDFRAVSSESLKIDSETSHTSASGSYRVYWNKPIESEVLDIDVVDEKTINPENKIDFQFLKDLVASRTSNRTPGRAMQRGPVLVKQRLSRVAIDGKIFSKLDSTRQRKKRIEIIILIDLSGSTRGVVADKEVGAAIEISKALTESNIPNSVYGHTSMQGEGRTGDTPFLIHIASHDMLVTNTDRKKRFEKLTYIKGLVQNYDGVAINLVSQKFTEKEGAKYVIVVSDGEPANGTTYSDQGAVDHTMSVIKSVRKMGITVFSMSVVRYVVPKNDFIYGREFNIDTSSNLRKQFRRLIKKITS